MKTLFIIDAYNLIYRMFYAIPEMHTRDGRCVNAIFWTAKFLKSLADDHPNDSIIVANDVGQSFRAKEYSEYKAQRDRMPDNLRSQIDGVFVLFEAAGIQILSQEGFEADDIIGSIVSERSNGWTDYQFVIISSDKDLCQFIRDGHIHIYDAMKRKFMKERDVVEKFGVPVWQVVDYLAIVWDSSDNIPWIAGFGPKKAVDLLSKYGSLGDIYRDLWVMNYEIWARVEKDEQQYSSCDLTTKTKETLVDQIENAFLSQKLATIITDLEISLKLTSGDTLSNHLQREEYLDLLREYEFRSLLPRAEEITEKTLDKKQVLRITNQEWLLDLQNRIEKSEKCTLSTDGDTLWIAVEGSVFLIDPKYIDLNEFISWLLGSDIEIRGYELKEDYKRLLAIQKPLQKEVEGQGKLF